MNFNLRDRILPVALVAALIGGTVGAFVGRTTKTTEPAGRSVLASALTNDDAAVRDNRTLMPERSLTPSDAALVSSNNVDPQYREGFLDGFRAATSNDRVAANYSGSNRAVTTTRVVERPVYRSARGRTYSNSRQAYYDYNNQPRSRSFWQKHRDKLTVAMGTGGGALLGGLIGGHKGAAIGALAGAGGSALYTYKIRNRNRRY
jgi:hypothetical protein